MKPNPEVIKKHSQLSQYSCIPMSVEFILKLIGKLDPNNFYFQSTWGNKSDGSFADFDNATINDVQFKQQFSHPRDEYFPLDELFGTIEKELSENKFVVISLEVTGGWHNYIIYDQLPNGEFQAITKGRDPNNEIENVREIVRSMNGSDILTYKINL